MNRPRGIALVGDPATGSDENGFPATPAVGDQVKVFATQASNLPLTAVIVFAEGGQGSAPGDNG